MRDVLAELTGQATPQRGAVVRDVLAELESGAPVKAPISTPPKAPPTFMDKAWDGATRVNNFLRESLLGPFETAQGTATGLVGGVVAPVTGFLAGEASRFGNVLEQPLFDKQGKLLKPETPGIVRAWKTGDLAEVFPRGMKILPHPRNEQTVKDVTEKLGSSFAFEPTTQFGKTGMEAISKAMEPVAGFIDEAGNLVGESWGSGTMADLTKGGLWVAFGEGTKGLSKQMVLSAKDIKDFVRTVKVKERGLVLSGIKRDIEGGTYTTAQIRDLWRDPANREALIKKYVQGQDISDVGSRRPMTGHGTDIPKALPAGQTFELKDYPTIKELVSREAEPLALPPGQGFTLPKETPYLPAKSTAIKMPYEPRDVLAELGEKPVEKPKIETVQPDPIQTAEALGLKHNGTMGEGEKAIQIYTEPKYGATFSVKKGEDVKAKLEAKLKEFETAGNKPIATPTKAPTTFREYVEAKGVPWAGIAKNPDYPKLVEEWKSKSAPVTIAPHEIVQPGANKEAVLFPAISKTYNNIPVSGGVKTNRATKKGPQNLITRILAEGGLKVSGDYSNKYLKQYPDLKRIIRNTGVSPDDMAAILKDEGYLGFKSGDELIELLKDGQGKKTFTPESMDAKIESQIRSIENEWIEKQLAELEEQGLDARASEKSSRDIVAGLESKIAEERLSKTDAEAALNELSDFFESVTPTAKKLTKEDQIDIPGASFKDTFDLAPSPGTLGDKPKPHIGNKTAKLFDAENSPVESHVPAFSVSPNDIPHELAYRAHTGTSMIPERRADQVRESYVAEVQQVYDSLKKYAKTEKALQVLDSEMARFKSGYAAKTREWLSSRAGVVSPMIAGPSKFPAARMQKRLGAEHNKLKAIEEWKAKAINSITRTLKELAIEEAGGEIAVAQKKLESLKKQQEAMKVVNSIIRKKISDDAKIKQITEQTGISEGTARKTLEPDYMGRKGFPAYELQNNLAKIKHTEERIATLIKRDVAEGKETSFDGGRVIENTDINRLQIVYDSKPTPEIISKLKSNGFRWAPSESAWQRQLTDNARWAAKKLLDEQRGSMPLEPGSEIVRAILATKGKIKEAMPHLENLGRRLYESGKTKFTDWYKGMEKTIGPTWKSFIKHSRDIFAKVSKPLMNEKGSVGLDIKNNPIIKQRKFKKGDKELEAPPVRKSDLETIQTMKELRPKPLGGWIENPLRTFEELGKDAKELFYRPVKEAEHRAKVHMKQLQEKALKMKKDLPFGASKRIGTYAIAQQKDGLKILESMGIKAVPKLSPQEMRAYEWMRRGLEIFYNKLQDARARAGKEPFGKVENYFTFFREMSIAEKMGFSPVFTRENLLQNVMHRKTTPFRFEKSRVGGLSGVDLDAFNVFLKYMDSATRHYYLSPVIAKGREMLLSFKGKEGEVYRLADDKPRAAMFITEWLDFVAGQRKAQLPHLVERGLTVLNKNLAFAILSANVRSALIQPSALVSTIAEIGPKWTSVGIKSILDNTGVEKSNVLLSRRFDVSATEAISGHAGRVANARTKIAQWGIEPLQWIDFQTAKATWNGAYRKALSEGMNERAAVNYADDTVTRTQGSAMPSDMAPIQRTALGKALTMFQTFVINQWGFLTKDVLGIKNASISNKQAFKKAMGFVVGATLFNMLYEDGLGINSPMPSPLRAFNKAIEDGEDIPSASVEAAKEIASLVPVIGGGLRYGTGFMGATLEHITDIGKKVAGAKGPTKSWWELAGKTAGVPGTTQAAKMARIAEKDGSPLDMILGRYPEKKTNPRRLSE